VGSEFATTPTLSDLATLVYESALVIGNDSLLGHLASNLNIPTLILADDPERLQLWRPDWAPSHLLFPPAYLPKRLRKKYWSHLISPQRVFHTAKRLLS
jgi:ADP-heptose:LPS heptosyltransferase